MKDCIFCKIINKEINSNIVYEDDEIIAFNDIHPIAPVHILVIPKKHYESIDDVDTQTLIYMFEIAKKYAKLIINILNEKGCSFTINYGDKQEIKHIHLHIMPDFNKKPSKSVEDVYKLIKEGINEKKIKEEN